MNIGYIVIVTLVSAGMLVELLCCIGVLAMTGVFAKLHYLGPASSLGAILIAAAVVVQDGFTQASVKAVILALILLLSSPIISHATARMAKIRSEAGWDEDAQAVED